MSPPFGVPELPNLTVLRAIATELVRENAAAGDGSHSMMQIDPEALVSLIDTLTAAQREAAGLRARLRNIGERLLLNDVFGPAIDNVPLFDVSPAHGDTQKANGVE